MIFPKAAITRLLPLASAWAEDQEVTTAPSKPNVLKQSGEATYPVALKDGMNLKEGFVEVKFKPVSGKEAQAGGVIWRAKDADIMIAMAGLAEAAFLYGLLMVGTVLLMVGGLLAFAWWKRSTIAATLACILVFLVGLLFQPWSAFSPRASADPDEAYWLVRLRVATVIWALLFVAGPVCLTTVIRRRKMQTPHLLWSPIIESRRLHHAQGQYNKNN
jgi:hypothetical protein